MEKEVTCQGHGAVENEDGDSCGCTGWEGGCLVVAPAHGVVARSCPPPASSPSPSFGHLKLKAVLSISPSSPGAGISLPGGGGKGEDDAAGEGHRAQAAQLRSPRLAPLCIYFSLCEQNPLHELSSPTPYGWARSQARGSKDGLGRTVVSSPPVWGSSQCLLPGCHSCPQLAGDAGTQHSGQLQEVTGDPGEPFPAAEQPSCTDTRVICTGVAVEMHTEMIFLCKPVLWLVDLKEQD